MFSRPSVLLFALLALVASACSSGDDAATSLTTTTEAPDAESATTEPPADSATTEAPDVEGKPIFDVPTDAPVELEIDDLIPGTGKAAQSGDYLTMHYVGVRQTDGGQFDASWDRGSTFGFTLSLIHI